MRFIGFIALILNITQTKKVTLESCLTCAKSSNFFCQSPKMFENHWDVQCCYPGSSNPNCKETNDILCSHSYSKSKS